MLRPLPLLFAAALPVVVAAPVPRDARPGFGASHLLTRADLDLIRFDTRPAKDRDEFDEQDEPDAEKPGGSRPPNRYDLAVHVRGAPFREGDPVPAYFVLRNNRGSVLSLDARLELFGPNPMVWNSCGIGVRDAKTGNPVPVVGLAGWACGGGGLVDVPADGFYCVRGDLGRTPGGKPLPPGEYEVDWRCARLRSAPVRFAVAKAGDPVPPAVGRPTPHFFRIVSGEDDDRPAAGGPVVWRGCELAHAHAGEVSAALAVGHAGVYAPDLHAVPAADGLIEASLEWRPYRDGDRAVVTLRAGPKFKEVRFADLPELHLQVDAPGSDRAAVALARQAKAFAKSEAETRVTPLTIEARLPAGWRERCGVEGAARLSVLVTSGELELPRGRGVEQRKVLRDEVDPAARAGRPPVWSGVVRTGSVELRFPPPAP